MTAKGPVPGGQHPLDNPKSRPRTVSHSRIPDLAPPREPLCDRLKYAPQSCTDNARICRAAVEAMRSWLRLQEYRFAIAGGVELYDEQVEVAEVKVK